MDIHAIEAIRSLAAGNEIQATSPTGAGAPAQGGNLFQDALRRLVESQQETDRAIEALIAGEPVDMHAVMISVEQTDLTFRLALQLRNKLVKAYDEVMRMQV
ncbi:MAG TPA: flagellar hook-basal body complex protein FliE [Chloroflexi bacterium]|jgi:flagellar hook-basal body complex protein FliE|nr:flagellar hook-basal body complex protein FliE [Chloroflexota bacterium]